MARKNGCPFNVRDWVFKIRTRYSTNASPVWIPIRGANTMDYSADADTEDGSSAQDLDSEPYVTKRSRTLNLECKRILDRVTGAVDPGQAEMEYFATLGGCDADARIMMTDAVGNSTILDLIVTSVGHSADDTSETVSYDTEIVGAPIPQTYVQITDVTVNDNTTPITTLSLAVNATKELTVVPAPSTASNQKYTVASSDTTKVNVIAIDGLTFEIQAIATGTANVIVTMMNNTKTETIAVTVTA